MNKSLSGIQPEDSTKPQNPKSYLEVKIPVISFNEKALNPYFMIIAIAVFSFLLGMMTDKILYLQNAPEVMSSNVTADTGNTQALNNPPVYPTLPPKVEVSAGSLPIIGNENAKVTIVEFSDIQCPFCKQFHDNTYQQIYDEYIKTGKAKFAYRHFPLKSIHPNAQKSAEAVECANEQGKFWEYLEELFANQSVWSPQSADQASSTFTDYASSLGLNADQFRSCLDSGKYAQNVDNDMADADKIGVNGTPAFFINGWRLTGAQPFSAIQEKIEEELKK